jgi:lipopolysaccharide transport system permease protein
MVTPKTIERTQNLRELEGARADIIETVIRPPKGWAEIGFRELAAYWELAYFLTWREVKVRYKQTGLGVAWAVLQPVLTMLIFSLFFGRLAKMPSDGVPYPIFALTGLVPWMFFANGLSQSSNSLVVSASLITKVYFPRLILPLASVLSGLVDLCLGFIVLLGFMFYQRVWPTWNALWLPVFALLGLLTALGTGLWLSALNVKYRDVRYTLPFLTQFWMFATPIVYPSSLLHEPWRTLYGLNPMAGVIEGFRWALLGTKTAPGLMMLASTGAALVILAGGVIFFRRQEDSFADIV